MRILIKSKRIHVQERCLNLRALLLIVATFSLLMWEGAGNSCLAQGEINSKVKAVFDQWDKRTHAAESVYYKLSGNRIYFAGMEYGPGEKSVLAPEAKIGPAGFPEEDTEVPLELEWLIDFRTGRFSRRESTKILAEPLMKYVPRTEVTTYDGESVVSWTPKEDTPEYQRGKLSPDINLWTSKDVGIFITNSYDLPILFAHGYKTLKSHDFTEHPLSLQKGIRMNGESVIAGNRCHVLSWTNKAQVNFHVDARPEYLGAIRQYEFQYNGKTQSLSEIEWQQTEQFVHPINWEIVSSNQNGKPVWKTSLAVQEFKYNPEVQDEDFIIPIRPEMIVNRRSDKKLLRVESDGKSLKEIDFKGESLPVQKQFPWIWVQATGLFVIALAVFLKLNRS